MKNDLGRNIRKFASDERFSEIWTGSMWALGGQAVASVLGLTVGVMVARLYGAEMVGVLAMVQAFSMFASMFTLLGTNSAILRLIPEHIAKFSVSSAHSVYLKIRRFVGCASLLAGGLLFLAADLIAIRLFSKPDLSLYFSLAAAFLIFRSFSDLATQAARGLRMLRIYAVFRVLPSLSLLIALVVLTAFRGGQGSPVYAQLAAWGVTALVGVWFVGKYFREHASSDDVVQSVPLKKILHLSSPMLITTSMQFVLGQTGVVLIGMFASEAEVGYYAIAVKLATLVTFILQAINTMAAPKFSELHSMGATDELFYVARKSARLIFWSTTPILLLLLVGGKAIMGALYGVEFVAAYPAMLLLVTGQFVSSISGSTGYFMNMTGGQVALRNIMISAGVLNIILGVALIPEFGIVGAAFAGMSCSIFWNVAALMWIKAKYGRSIAYIPCLTGEESQID